MNFKISRRNLNSVLNIVCLKFINLREKKRKEEWILVFVSFGFFRRIFEFFGICGLRGFRIMV